MIAIAAGLLLACMILYPAQSVDAALLGLRIWSTAVLPALFPYMVCAQLLAASGAPLVVLALLGGSPTGARLIATQPGIASRAAERFACLTGTVSPMFLLGTVSLWTGDPRLGWVLLGAHWGGAALVGLLGRWLLRSPSQPAAQSIHSHKKTPLSEVLSGAALAMLSVGGCILLFTVAARMVGCVLPYLSSPVHAVLHSVLEMAGGAADVAALGLPPRAQAASLAAVVSFGGLSILAQNMGFLSACKVRFWVLLAARVTHALAAAAIAFVLI